LHPVYIFLKTAHSAVDFAVSNRYAHRHLLLFKEARLMIRTMSHCPYCHAPTASDSERIRRYSCGTYIIKCHGVYTKQCS
jgi:hypothetical protein